MQAVTNTTFESSGLLTSSNPFSPEKKTSSHAGMLQLTLTLCETPMNYRGFYLDR